MFHTQVQRQKRKPNKEDNTSVPCAKRHATESECPILSQQYDNMDVSEDCSAEESEVPFVALHSPHNDSGVISHEVIEAAGSLNDSRAPALELPFLDFGSSKKENTCSAHQEVVMEENVPVNSADVSGNTIQRMNTKPCVVDEYFSSNILHDHSYLQIHGKEVVKVEETGNNSTNVDCGEENKTSHVDCGMNEAGLRKKLSRMVDHTCVEGSSHSNIKALDTADVDLCSDVEEGMQLDHEGGNEDLLFEINACDAGGINLGEIRTMSRVDSRDFMEVRDELCPGNSPHEQETCVSTYIDATTQDCLAKLSDIASNTADTNLAKQRDSSKHDSFNGTEDSNHHTCQGNLALSPMQTDAVTSLEEEQTSQELIPRPVSVEGVTCDENSESTILMLKEVTKEVELNRDVADLCSQADPQSLPQAYPCLQMQRSSVVCSANSLVTDNGNEKLQEVVNSNLSLEGQSSLSTTVGDGLHPASKLGESSSDDEPEYFTSLAQLTADNLEILQYNLQVVPSSVGRRLYQTMVNMLSHFPQYFEKS